MLVYAEIGLINGGDFIDSLRRRINENQIKFLKVKMRIDPKVTMLAINEKIQSELQLPIVDKRKLRISDDSLAEFDIVAPVEVRFWNRSAMCSAIVLPGNSEPILGLIPLPGTGCCYR